jgi:hypothetical protein
MISWQHWHSEFRRLWTRQRAPTQRSQVGQCGALAAACAIQVKDYFRIAPQGAEPGDIQPSDPLINALPRSGTCARSRLGDGPCSCSTHLVAKSRVRRATRCLVPGAWAFTVG